MTVIQNASVLNALQSGVQFFLQRTNQNGQNVQAGLQSFWDEVRPDIYQLLVDAATGQIVASESLELFADAAVARASRLSLGFADQERAALGAILLAGLKTAVALAVTAAL